MLLGKDFWKVMNFLKFIISFFEAWSRDNNEDTPKGSV